MDNVAYKSDEENVVINYSQKNENDGGFQNGHEDIFVDAENLANPKKNDTNFLIKLQIYYRAKVNEHAHEISVGMKIFLNVIFVIYFAYATYYYLSHPKLTFNWADGYGLLVLLFCFTYIFVFFYYCNKYIPWPDKDSFFGKMITCNFNSRYTNWILVASLIIAYIVFLFFDSRDHPIRMRSGLGLIFFMLIGYFSCVHPGNIRWKPVFMGTLIQVLFGLFTIRFSIGRDIFIVLGNKVTTFLNYTLEGAAFVYGNILVYGTDTFPSIFAFNALPVIFFMSFIVNVLYYYGIIQAVVTNLGWALGSVMGTTICESINCVSNIFLGMTESPLLLKPYLKSLTKSELHAVMLSGFAAVSGTVLAAYISFGAKASHLITACVMTAPATLAFAKLNYPEVEKSKSTVETIELIKSSCFWFLLAVEPGAPIMGTFLWNYPEDSSVLDAAAKGANNGIPIIMGVIANLISFIAMVAFLNALVQWFGTIIGYDYITFEWIMTQVFTPISWLMGVEWDECGYVGNLIALKTVINEFVAYQKLSQFKAEGLLSPRSEMIATYSVCGFSNPGSVGIMIGTMSSLMPERADDITALSIRSFIGGAIVCFITACFAGMLAFGDEFNE